MTYSLNEIEATAKRAARGAGYSWGLAEDAGKATRWLCANGLDGVAVLTGLLDRQMAGSVAHSPKMQDGTWQGDDVLCPLAAGTYLSDCAHELSRIAIRMQRVSFPLMILPFAANVALVHKTCVSVGADGQLAFTDGRFLRGADSFPDHAIELTVEIGGDLSEQVARLSRGMPDPDSWNRLNSYAHRTYAPATDESRLLGAGAGLSDND